MDEEELKKLLREIIKELKKISSRLEKMEECVEPHGWSGDRREGAAFRITRDR